MKCFFCKQEKKLTKEHAFPNWLCKLYPDWDIVTHEFSGTPTKTGESKIFQLQTKTVCNECNAGWMSKLEQEVQPIIHDLITLEGIQVDKLSQEILAFWAQKTVLMLNQSVPGDLKITQDLYDELYIHKAFSNKVMINLGWRMNFSGDKSNPIASYQIKQIKSIDVKKSIMDKVMEQKDKGGFVWSAIIAIGPMVFELIGHNMNFKLEVNANTKVFKTIRPYIADIDWPLEWPIEAEGGLDVIKSRS